MYNVILRGDIVIIREQKDGINSTFPQSMCVDLIIRHSTTNRTHYMYNVVPRLSSATEYPTFSQRIQKF
jgi:hypothetical protein